MDKTNAMRLLDARKVRYAAKVYDAAREFHDAVEVAALIGAPVESVYKTLVVLRDVPGKSKPLLVMIPAANQIDLKLLAKEIGEKRLRMAAHKEAEQLTGLHVGGISALALLNRGFEVYLDASAQTQETIHVSAGVRGVDLEVNPRDLIAVTRAKVVRAT
jgi:Cys-tRNA(Pro)/Cys-tRNA(Cys) deacylase